MGTEHEQEISNDERAYRILNAIESNVAVINSEGVIVFTNGAWDDFASSNCMADGSIPKNIGLGANYLEVCQNSIGPSDENAFLAHKGIKDVLAGKRREFSLEYPCHSPSTRRWFLMKVILLRGSKPREAVIFHTNITAQKQAEIESYKKQMELADALGQLQTFAEQIKKTIARESSSLATRTPPNKIRSAVYGNPTQQASDALKLLSKREKEILEALARGERNTDIASRLGLSIKSVSTYRTRVLDKLNANSNADLVGFVTRLDLPTGRD